MNYGLPYKGSKNRIANKLLEYLPSGEVFVDLFCGGCAMTHAAMLSGKYEKFIANDINDICPKLFNDAILGKYRNEKRWISRDEFSISDEPYVKFCWSFGNNLRNYLYSRKIEPYKKACHYAIVFDDWELLKELCPEVSEVAFEALNGITDTKERRLKFSPPIVKWLKTYGTSEMVENNPLYKSCQWRGGFDKRHGSNDLQSLQRLQSLESLERLQRLQSLESLESLERLEISSKSYEEVSIPKNSVVYCDIPYRGTDGYNSNRKGESGFDHDRFYRWAISREFPVFISEYNCPRCFHEVAVIEHTTSLSAKNTKRVQERLYCTKPVRNQNVIQLDLFNEKYD